MFFCELIQSLLILFFICSRFVSVLWVNDEWCSFRNSVFCSCIRSCVHSFSQSVGRSVGHSIQSIIQSFLPWFICTFAADPHATWIDIDLIICSLLSLAKGTCLSVSLSGNLGKKSSSFIKLLQHVHHSLRSVKLTKQWKMDHLKMYFLLNTRIFQCHGSLPEGIHLSWESKGTPPLKK